MRVAGVATLSVCLATAALAQALKAEGPGGGEAGVEHGTNEDERLR